MFNIFRKLKDGGPESPVDAFFLFEIKKLGSIALLRFKKGGRREYYSHAFNAFTWFLWGDLLEENLDGTTYAYRHTLLPKVTPRTQVHRVKAYRDSWCLTIRGPWQDTWVEVSDDKMIATTFTLGRKVLHKRLIGLIPRS